MSILHVKVSCVCSRYFVVLGMETYWFSNKASLHCKQALFMMQRSLVFKRGKFSVGVKESGVKKLSKCFEETGVKNTEVKTYALSDRQVCRKTSYELADRRSSVPLDNTAQIHNHIELQRITISHRIIIQTRYRTFQPACSVLSSGTLDLLLCNS